MKRTLISITQQMIDTVESAEWRRMIYILSFFNTTVQECCKFGPLGWAIPYEFNASDFSASLAFMAGQIVLIWKAVEIELEMENSFGFYV